MKRKSIRIRRSAASLATGVIFFLLSLLVLFPVVYMLCNSFMSPSEVSRYYNSAFDKSGNMNAVIHLIPDIFSMESYYQVFLRRPEYLMKFWLSLLLCGCIIAGQVVVSCMGGFAFAKYRFRGRKILFFILILLMLMPVQVTLVPNYIVLDRLGLLDTYFALILPMVFAPFGTFLMAQIFKSIPDELLEAAQLDGASTAEVLIKVAVPAGKGGVISLILLELVDAWNMVEQPVVFLKDSSKYPLSVFLASVNESNFPLSFACGVLAALPVILLFLFFNEELIEGIEFSGIK